MYRRRWAKVECVLAVVGELKTLIRLLGQGLFCGFGERLNSFTKNSFSVFIKANTSPNRPKRRRSVFQSQPSKSLPWA
jgi:hypothetical protein